MKYYRIKELMLEGLAILADIYPYNRIKRMNGEKLWELYNEFSKEKECISSFYFKGEKDIANKIRYIKKVNNFLIDAEYQLVKRGVVKH